MACTGREVESAGGGTGLQVAGPVRPAADRGRYRGVVPPGGGPVARRDAVRPGARLVRLDAGASCPGPVRPGAGARSSPDQSPLRLTRRGWCALSALGMAALALAVLVLTAALGAGGDLELAGGSSVVVRSGDTVWSIAAEAAGAGDDVRAVVDAIERINELQGARIVPGQVLELP